ncbi:11654_t:CDS:2, partial [Entrophospora sp. SA101]
MIEIAEIANLRKENAEVKSENIKVKVENAKLKQALEKHEARFMNLEQRDKEKTNLIAILDDDIKEIKQSLANTSISPKINSDNIPEQMENTSDNAPNSDVCQETKTQCSASSICIETKSSENKEMNDFLDSLHKEKIRSQDLSLDNISQSNKNKIQKFMLEISENSNLQLQYT